MPVLVKALKEEMEPFLHRFAYVAAGHAVTPCLKGGSGNKQIAGFILQHIHDPGKSLFRMRAHKVVAANHGVRDLGSLERRLESHAGAHHALHDIGLLVCLILSAHTGEELVEITDNLLHAAPP